MSLAAMSKARSFLRRKFEIAHPGSTRDNRSMEGIRGIAVGMVFLVHYASLMGPWMQRSWLVDLAAALERFGSVGVDIFFVLSGYLIYRSLMRKPQGFGKFMWRRVVRIYPAFLVVFAAYVALSFLLPSQSKMPEGGLHRAVLLAQNLLLLPGIFPITPIVTVAWSLSYEMAYYLAMPALIALFRLRERTPMWRISFLLLLTCLTLVVCGEIEGPVRLVMFNAGMLIQEIRSIDTVGRPSPGSKLFCLALAVFAGLLPDTDASMLSVKAGALFLSLFVLGLASLDESAASLRRVLSWTPLRWLGNMSYSYYLLHGLVLKALFVLLPPLLVRLAAWDTPMFFVLWLPLFAITLIPTAVLFLLVERPLSLATPHPSPQPNRSMDPAAQLP